MNKAYKAPNGGIIIAKDEVQAAAFDSAGLKCVEEEVKPRKKQTEE